MSDTVVKVSGASKKFCRTSKHTMLYGSMDLVRNFIGLDQRSDKLRNGEFWALDDFSFELKRGECLGLLGPNGSGKSTLLRMLNGIFMPDKGSITIQGRVGALIEIGAGFHPLLTGRENIYINGSILGMRKREIDEKFKDILDFAEIGDFVDSPVKHYSSGMYVRLGFAIAAHLMPDILLIDEVLAVGDLSFQIKCMNHIQKLIQSGVSVIFVSHNLYQIQRICSSGIILSKGKQMASGNSSELADTYEKEFGFQNIYLSTAKNISAFQFLKVSIETVNKNQAQENDYFIVDTHAPLCIHIRYKLSERFPKGIQIGLIFKTADGVRISGFTTMDQNKVLPGDIGHYTLSCELTQNLLMVGNYFIGLSAFDDTYTHQLSAWEPAAKFRVVTKNHNGLYSVGIVTFPHFYKLVKEDNKEIISL